MSNLNEPETEPTCEVCGVGLCGRQVLISHTLASRFTLRCLYCLGELLCTPPQQLGLVLTSYLETDESLRREWCAAAVCNPDRKTYCCPSQLEHASRPPGWYRPELFACEANSPGGETS